MYPPQHIQRQPKLIIYQMFLTRCSPKKRTGSSLMRTRKKTITSVKMIAEMYVVGFEMSRERIESTEIWTSIICRPPSLGLEHRTFGKSFNKMI